MPVAKLTDQSVRSLPSADTGTVFYSDEKDKRLQLAIGKKKRTWYATSTVQGRFIRQRLGEWPHVNANEARRLHSRFVGEVSKGEDPRAKTAGTLQHWLDLYLERKTARGKLRPTTAKQYRYYVQRYAKAFLERDLRSITRSEMVNLHEQMRAHPCNANLLMRILKAIYRFADKLEDIPDPTKPIEMYREHKRVSKVGDLPAWRAAVDAIGNPYRRAALLTCIYTGLRRQNLCEVRWENVDLDEGTLTVPLTKAGRRITIPLSEQVIALLNELPVQGDYVFYSPTSVSGHLVELRGDVPGRIHDLRREFATACTSAGIPWQHAKLLMDHSIPGVTGGYIMGSNVDLRASAQAAADQLDRAMTPPQSTRAAPQASRVAVRELA